VTGIYCPGSLYFAIDEGKSGKWRFGANAGVNCGRAEGPYFFGAGNCFNCAVDKVKIFCLELFMNCFGFNCSSFLEENGSLNLSDLAVTVPFFMLCPKWLYFRKTSGKFEKKKKKGMLGLTPKSCSFK
jgi:hypothetical protein